VGAAVFWPDALLAQEMLAASLALIPGLLLAHYRGWAGVTTVLGVGLVALCFFNLWVMQTGDSFDMSFLILFVLAPYIAIALGAGWFGEVRRYQTELRTTQLQLIQSEKLDSVGRMAAGVAHEVKNPLMVILTGIKILSRRMKDSDDATHTLLDDMTNAVTRADKIIGGLLNYSREHDVELSEVDVRSTIEKSLLLVKHELDKQQIAVVKEFDDALPRLRLDDFKIQQVFVNVLTNAVHAIGADGQILVRATVETMTLGRNTGHRKTDKYVPGQRVAVVTIDDSGPGIPEAHLDKIFDPFFTTKPTGVGTGLGLSVSRRIVEMHGGELVIGNRDGGGARVRIVFTLP
jgi:signal transduction histidine kinase